MQKETTTIDISKNILCVAKNEAVITPNIEKNSLLETRLI